MHPAGGVENARAVQPGRRSRAGVSHTALDGRKRPPTAYTGVIVLDLDQQAERVQRGSAALRTRASQARPGSSSSFMNATIAAGMSIRREIALCAPTDDHLDR